MANKYLEIIKPRIFYRFCFAELFILIALKIVSLVQPESLFETSLMFSAILINAIFMLFLTLQVKKAKKNMAFIGIPLAVFGTLLADCFLVLAYDLSTFGIIRFITPDVSNMIGFFAFGVVQVIYAYYLDITKRRLIIRVGFYVLFVVVVYAMGLMTLDRLIACLSMSQLILNVVYAWIENHKKRTLSSLLFAIGITLFFGCDACIMFRMLLAPVGIVYSAICFMVWVFYIPSQVVLTTAYLYDREKA